MTAGRRLRITALAGCGVTALCGAQGAFGQSLSYAEVAFSTGANYSTNPFLVTGNDAGAGSANIEVRPHAQINAERGSLDLSAFYNRTEYFRRYDGVDSYGGSLGGSFQASSTVSVQSSVNYINNLIVAADIFGVGTIINPDGSVSPAPTIPGAVDPSLGNAGLLGTRQRRELVSESLAVSIVPSARDTFSISANAARSRYPGAPAGIDNYRQYGAGGSYSRRISEATTIGLRANYSKVDYDRSNFGSNVFSPELTWTQQLADHWRLSASAGASIIKQTGTGFSNTSTNFSFSIQACRDGERSNLCLNASRSASSTATDGVRQQTVASIFYGYRIDERMRLGLQATYSRSPARNGLSISNQDFYYSDLSLSRQLARQLSLTAGVSAQGAGGDTGVSRPVNVAARIGLSYTLGGRR